MSRSPKRSWPPGSAKEELSALQTLKAEDPAAAFYWLERRVYYVSMFNDPEPASKAYLQFSKVIRDIEKRYAPEKKKAEAAKNDASDKAGEIYDAEVEKAEELYEENKVKP